jgi:hypothetical protein
MLTNIIVGSVHEELKSKQSFSKMGIQDAYPGPERHGDSPPPHKFCVIRSQDKLMTTNILDSHCAILKYSIPTSTAVTGNSHLEVLQKKFHFAAGMPVSCELTYSLST